MSEKVVTVGFANSSVSSYSIQLTKLLCETLGYTCKFLNLSTNEYGIKDSSGNWTGLLKQLKEGIFNTSVPLFTPTYERFEDFSFTQLGLNRDVRFFTRAPGIHNPGKYSDIFKPLNLQLWGYLMLTILIMAILIVIIQHFRTSMKLEIQLYFIDTFLVLLVYLARKGPIIKQSKNPTKIILIFWGFASIALVASYSSGLLSAMLKSPTSLPFCDIQTLATCIEEEKCQMIKTSGGNLFLSAVQSAAESSELFKLKMALSKKPILNVSSIPEMLDRILSTKDKFLVTWPSGSMHSATKENACGFSSIYYSSELSTFPFRKNDPLAQLFDTRLKQLQSAGLTEPLEREYQQSITTCSQEQNGRKSLKAYALRLNSFYSFLIFIFGGFCAALVLLLFELILQGKL